MLKKRNEQVNSILQTMLIDDDAVKAMINELLCECVGGKEAHFKRGDEVVQKLDTKFLLVNVNKLTTL